MMKKLEEEAKKQNVVSLKVKYYNLSYIDLFEKLLDKAGWDIPTVYSTFYHVDLAKVEHSFWNKRLFAIPSSYEIIRWDKVITNELKEFKNLEEAEFQPYFFPLHRLEDIVPSCSFIIKQHDEIVAWSIIEQTIPRVLKYRMLYIREAHRQAGLGVRLGMETARHIHNEENDKLVIEVVTQNKGMRKIVNKIKTTLSPTSYECRTSEKLLEESMHIIDNS